MTLSMVSKEKERSRAKVLVEQAHASGHLWWCKGSLSQDAMEAGGFKGWMPVGAVQRADLDKGQ